MEDPEKHCRRDDAVYSRLDLLEDSTAQANAFSLIGSPSNFESSLPSLRSSDNRRLKADLETRARGTLQDPFFGKVPQHMITRHHDRDNLLKSQLVRLSWM